MKNKLLLLLSIFIICSCNETMIGYKEDPFIVVKIYKAHTHEGMSVYHGNYKDKWGEGILLLPTGMFNIGDTIKICK